MAWPIALAAGATALNAYGRYRAGDSAKKAAKFEAAQLERQANERKAVSQRQAMEYDRQGRLQMSRALAVAAASGGGASDPTVMDVMGDIAGETNYLKMTALYEGEEQAKTLGMAAGLRRQEGDLAKEAGKIGAASSILSGATSMYSRFNLDTDAPWIKRGWDYASGHAFPGGPRKI